MSRDEIGQFPRSPSKCRRSSASDEHAARSYVAISCSYASGDSQVHVGADRAATLRYTREKCVYRYAPVFFSFPSLQQATFDREKLGYRLALTRPYIDEYHPHRRHRFAIANAARIIVRTVLSAYISS